MKNVVMCHEPGVGFAADAYARVTGLGVAVITYGVGALNMVNPVAQAYAEESPLLVLTGAPEIKHRNPNALLHHRVKTFESQHRVYQEVTEASAVIDDASTAVGNIDRVIDTVLKKKRPGYIEIPRDMVNERIDVRAHRPSPEPPRSEAELHEALTEILARLNRSKRPVAYVDVEVERYGLMDDVIRLVEKLNVPVVSTLMGKTAFPESHPHFVGNYMGAVGPQLARKVLEESDCILALGTLITDFSTGIFTARIDTSKMIHTTAHGTTISYHRYPDVTLADVVKFLLGSRAVKRWRFHHIPPKLPQERETISRLTTVGILQELNAFIQPYHCIVSDCGDCLFIGLEIKTDLFVGPGYYASMGFGVPGAIGAKCALPHRRPIVMVGDGGFMMTGNEFSTACKLGHDTIVILMNNNSYATLRYIDRPRPYYDLPDQDYARIAESMGGRGERVRTRREFQEALRHADASNCPYLIDAVIAVEDCSPILKRLAQRLGSLWKKT
jgi:indolepyruvate decarboxylase